MDVTLKEPANIAASGPSGHKTWQNVNVFASLSPYIYLNIIQGRCSAGHVTNSSPMVSKIRALDFFLRFDGRDSALKSFHPMSVKVSHLIPVNLHLKFSGSNVLRFSCQICHSYSYDYTAQSLFLSSIDGIFKMLYIVGQRGDTSKEGDRQTDAEQVLKKVRGGVKQHQNERISILCKFRQNSLPYVNRGWIMNALPLLLFALSPHSHTHTLAPCETQIRERFKGNIQRAACRRNISYYFWCCNFWHFDAISE